MVIEFGTFAAVLVLSAAFLVGLFVMNRKGADDE